MAEKAGLVQVRVAKLGKKSSAKASECTYGERCRYAHRELRQGERPTTPNKLSRPNSAPPIKSLVRHGSGKGQG